MIKLPASEHSGKVLKHSSSNINKTFVQSYLVFNTVLKTSAQKHE